MKIVVIGGTGRIGSKVVRRLRDRGHEVIAAAPQNGIDVLTGEGLEAAMVGTRVVVDLANSPSFEDEASLHFFRMAGLNLLAAETKTGVAHHVALSVVGTEKLSASGYFRAKLAQEKLIEAGPIPYTIVRATQFFEFVDGIADEGTVGDTVHLPPAYFQPMAAADVSSAVARVAAEAPLNGMTEVGGPEKLRLDELVRDVLARRNDPRTVLTDPRASYFGITPGESTLLPGPGARLAETRFEDWFQAQLAAA
jgi:uncharacterized protein YbjT (DUF2867 family)